MSIKNDESTILTLNKIFDIARRIRRRYFRDNERSYGFCYSTSMEIEDNLKLEGVNCKTITGIFHGTKDGKKGYFFHCWNEINIGKEVILLDATGSQFDDITEDIVYGPYSKFPQYRKEE